MSTKKGRYGNPGKRRMVQGDLQRLVQPSGQADPRKLGGQMVGGDSSREVGSVLIDASDSLLLEGLEVCLMGAVRDGQLDGEQHIFMTMDGRINRTSDRARVGVVLGSDGAAALISELLALTERAGPQMLADLVRRLVDLDQGRHGSIAWLRAALDVAEGHAE